MKSLLLLLTFFFTVTLVNASNTPVKNSNTLNFESTTLKAELVINTKGVKKLEDIDVVDFHKNNYLKLMLKANKAKKIC